MFTSETAIEAQTKARKDHTKQDSLAILDFAELAAENPSALQSLHDSLKQLGFFYLINHPLTPARIQEVFALTHGFFSLSQSDKESIALDSSPHYRGYSRIGQEETKGVPDFKEVLDFGLEAKALDGPKLYHTMCGPNLWPKHDSMHAMPQVMNSLMQELRGIGDVLMRAIALTLGLPKDFFLAQFEGEKFSLMRLIHYPDMRHPNVIGEKNSTRIGVGEHTDVGCLVLLLQDDVGGLEVKHPNGHWVQARPLEGSLVINMGDRLEEWTQHYFKATEHRVTNHSERDRYSIPFFYEPHLDTCLSQGGQPYGEHLLSFFKRSYPNHPASMLP